MQRTRRQRDLLPLQQSSCSRQPSSPLFLSYNSATLPSPTQHVAHTCNVYPHVSPITPTGWMFSSVNRCGVVYSAMSTANQSPPCKAVLINPTTKLSPLLRHSPSVFIGYTFLRRLLSRRSKREFSGYPHERPGSI